MLKNVALTHSSASAFSTAGVVGHGPSSKVRTTSLSRRKSCCRKCSKPKPGPPVVSISTVRLTPSALGLLQPATADLGWAAGVAEAVAGVRAGAALGTRAGAGATRGGAEPVVDRCAEAGPSTSNDADIAKTNAAAPRMDNLPKLTETSHRQRLAPKT